MKLVIHLDGTSIRGSENQVILLARMLRMRGHEILASCRPGGPVEQALRREEIRTSSLRPTGDVDLFHALRFAWWLRTERPDAILITSWRKALVAAWAARMAGVPRIALRVGGVHGQKRAVDRWKYRRALTRYYDALIVNSGAVEDHLRRTIPGLPGEIVHRIPNGIDVSVSPPVALREEIGTGLDSVLLVSAGGLERRKGFDLLISAVARLTPDVHVAIAGDGPERETLRALALSLGAGARVHLLGHRDDVPGIVTAADVFVLSSRGEGMAVAMLEAMVAGRPVVATDVGGVSDALAPREGRPPAGWIVPPDDEDALTRTLADVISYRQRDPASIDARASEARWRVENWFTVERMVDRYEQVLSDELEPSPPLP